MYTTDTAVRYYIDAQGTAGFGTDIVGTTQMAVNIGDSDSIIDMMLSKRFSVPFVSTPPAIATTSKVFTAWRSLRSVYSGEIPAAVEFVKDDYDKAMEWLQKLVDEEADLPSGSGTSSSGNTISEKGGGEKYWSSRQDYVPIFGMDNPLSWKVDPDLISDIADSKD